MSPDPLDPQYLRFCRPVCTETEDPHFPLQRIGSGFVLAFRGQYFFLSAKHIFSNNHADARRLWIPQVLGNRCPWIVRQLTLPEAAFPIQGSILHADIALFCLDPTPGQNGTIGSHDFLSITHAFCAQPGQNLFEQGHLLFASGFPDSFKATGTHSHIDYENEIIHTDLVPIEGVYVGPAADFGIHRFQSDHMLGSDPNGLSGGPVTTIDTSRIGYHRLVGMIIQGAENCDELLFIEAAMIVNLLIYIFPQLGATLPDES